MALTRGYGGLCPCPICLVRDTELSDLNAPHELRTEQKMMAAYNEAIRERTIERQEEIMKKYGLRLIKVHYVAHFKLLTHMMININRMSSGKCLSQMHMQFLALIHCMSLKMEVVESTCGHSSNCLLQQLHWLC